MIGWTHRRSVQIPPDVDSSNQTSSLVVFQRTPLRRHHPFASCPDCISARKAVVGVWPPSQTHLPFLSFFPTPTVYSANGLVGLLRPTASHGVRAVSITISLLPHCCDVWSLVTFPVSRIIPFEAFPSTTAVLCHHSRCLLAVMRLFCFQK